MNAVAIAFFVFDIPSGRNAGHLMAPLVVIAGDVTDLGRLVWILTLIVAVVAVLYIVSRRIVSLRHRRLRQMLLTQMGAYFGLSILAGSVVANLLKWMIGRARPPLYDRLGIFSFRPFHGSFNFESFPSAHSTNFGAFFTAALLLFPRYRPLLISLALWFAATRIIIDVHYPSDVVAGLCLGSWTAFVIAIFFSRFGILFSLPPAGGLPQPKTRRADRHNP